MEYKLLAVPMLHSAEDQIKEVQAQTFAGGTSVEKSDLQGSMILNFSPGATVQTMGPSRVASPQRSGAIAGVKPSESEQHSVPPVLTKILFPGVVLKTRKAST